MGFVMCVLRGQVLRFRQEQGCVSGRGKDAFQAGARMCFRQEQGCVSGRSKDAFQAGAGDCRSKDALQAGARSKGWMLLDVLVPLPSGFHKTPPLRHCITGAAFGTSIEQIVLACLRRNPTARPTCAALLAEFV